MSASSKDAGFPPPTAGEPAGETEPETPLTPCTHCNGSGSEPAGAQKLADRPGIAAVVETLPPAESAALAEPVITEAIGYIPGSKPEGLTVSAEAAEALAKAGKVIVSREDLRAILVVVDLYTPPDFRPSVIVKRLAAAAVVQ